ncbi:MAG TPA: hypothetical protein VGK56_09330 [Anaerolineales bacterium]
MAWEDLHWLIPMTSGAICRDYSLRRYGFSWRTRTTASPTGTKDYVFYRQGGWSWSIPYLAGMYALETQVQPEITPEQFWDTALDTGKPIHIGHNGKIMNLE